MAQYPIQDQDDLVDAVNYLLSGPSGTGQNLQGVVSYEPVWLRPTTQAPFILPYETTLDKSMYLDAPISNIVFVTPSLGDPVQITVTFTTPFANAPFQFGDQISLTGVTPADFDNDYIVYSSTTTEAVLARADKTPFNPTWTYISGGSLFRDYTNVFISTDCIANATVTSPTDRVVVNGQFGTAVLATSSALYTYDIIHMINRYRGNVENVSTSNSQAQNATANIVWTFDATVMRLIYPNNTAPGESQPASNITPFIDGPNLAPDYYQYRLEVMVVTKPTYGPKYFGRSGSLLSGQFSLSGEGQLGLIGIPSTFTGIMPTNITGTGVGATVDVFLNFLDPAVGMPADTTYRNNYNATITVTSGGSGYYVGDTMLITGDQLGGFTPQDDMTLTVTQVQYPGDVKPTSIRTRVRILTVQVVKQ